MKKLVPVFPWPMHPKVAEVLEQIEGIQLVEALPGGPGPVLAIGKPPTFACDAIVVSTPQKAAEGVAIVVSDGIKLVTMREWLSDTIGAEVPMEKLEKVESKVKFR